MQSARCNRHDHTHDAAARSEPSTPGSDSDWCLSEVTRRRLNAKGTRAHYSIDPSRQQPRSRRYRRDNRAEITAPRPNGRRTPAIGRHSDPHRGSRRDAVPGNESSASFEEHNIASVPPSLATSVVVHEDRHGSALGPRRKNRQNYIENDSTRQVRRSQQSDRPAPAAACQCVD